MDDSAYKPKRILSEEAKKKKRESDRERDKTRVNIGPAFIRWREIREETECKTDAELALLLLDFFQTRHMSSSPSKRPIESRPARVTEESGDEDIHNKGALLGCRETEEVGVELSMYSLSNTEDEQEDSTDEDEVVDIEGCWKDPTHKSLADDEGI